MGAALLGMSLEDDRLTAINIGDCRLYRIRENTIKQLTKDQTLVAEENRMGRITDEDARKHPKRHILSNAIGHMTNNSKIDIIKKSIIEKDIFLICSDGLYSAMKDDQILKIIRNNSDKTLYQMGVSLIIKANMAGGMDDITVVIISFD
ncbi:MAG: serine/threonine-protein phosphatase [Deltaproteobacteria bacterium]|nr:serine/threonine-protein phosphatase [Deltaproteobacteria bacterium]